MCYWHMQTAKAQISLGIHSVWSGPSLSTNRIIGYYRLYLWRAKVWIILYPFPGWSESANFAQVWRHLFTWCSPVTVLSTFLGKIFYAWNFVLNESILFWLFIFYQKPFVFSVSVFCSQIFTVKLNLRPKVGLTYANSIEKKLFFCLRKLLLFFCAEFELLMFHNNIVKISEKN